VVKQTRQWVEFGEGVRFERKSSFFRLPGSVVSERLSCIAANTHDETIEIMTKLNYHMAFCASGKLP
jgi:hypothetical protein